MPGIIIINNNYYICLVAEGKEETFALCMPENMLKEEVRLLFHFSAVVQSAVFAQVISLSPG